jgi:hypothetical protein
MSTNIGKSHTAFFKNLAVHDDTRPPPTPFGSIPNILEILRFTIDRLTKRAKTVL